MVEIKIVVFFKGDFVSNLFAQLFLIYKDIINLKLIIEITD